MTDNNARKLVWAHIESCLDVNSSWREMFNLYGILATIEFDDCLEDENYIIDDVAEELELTKEEVIREWRAYVCEYRLFTPEMVIQHMDYVIGELTGCGSIDEIVGCLGDWARREKSTDVMLALPKYVDELDEDDQEEWREEIQSYTNQLDGEAEIQWMSALVIAGFFDLSTPE